MLIPVETLAQQLWAWAITDGITLLIITVLAMLVPRVGRMAVTIFQTRLDSEAQESKSKLAIFSTIMYLAQLVAFFLLLVWFLKVLGFSLVGAAIPATVISAAVGLGAQSIIADFLAGFFVLQEKQFGVGDWVEFKGNGVDVQGDVIQMTMRATRVRTLSGETVLVPNSAARVCINHSNYWARAVAVVPVPLLGSSSIDEAISRSATAARRALSRPDIAPDIRGDLDVHPAVAIEKPTVVGMPWLADMRFVVQVNPARQWVVERAIRTAILDEFWTEYGSATTTSGTLRREVVTATDETEDLVQAVAAQLQERGEMGGFNDPIVDPDAEAQPAGASRRLRGARGYYLQQPRIDVPIDAVDDAKEPTNARAQGRHSRNEMPATAVGDEPHAKDSEAMAETDVVLESASTHQAVLQQRPGHTAVLDAVTEANEAAANAVDAMNDDDDASRRAMISPDAAAVASATSRSLPKPRNSRMPGAKYLSFGWRIRPSTTVLFLLLMVLLVIRGLTLETAEEYPNGAWAPKRPSAATTSPVPEPEVSTPPAVVPESAVPTTPTPARSEQMSAPADPGALPGDEADAPQEPAQPASTTGVNGTPGAPAEIPPADELGAAGASATPDAPAGGAADSPATGGGDAPSPGAGAAPH